MNHAPSLTLLALVVTAILVATPPAPAQAGELQQFDSRHYIIHTDLAADDIKPLARHMDAVFAAFKSRFSKADLGRDRRRGKENLYLFGDRTAYVTHMAQLGIDAANSGGMFFYRGNTGGLATWVNDKPRKVTLQTLQHEGFHQFAHRYIGGQLPLWLNEGLAVYFEQARLVNNKLKIGVAEPHRISAMRDALEKNTQFDIHSLITITSDQWFANMAVPEKGALQYTQSWAICHFLIHANRGRYQRAFDKYLSLISSGRESDRAFEQAFGTDDYKAMESKWRAYVEEQMQPDEYSVMIERIEFLAFAAQSLSRRGAALPDTLDGFKQLLQANNFRVSFGEHHQITADDDALYQYEVKGKQVPFEYEPDGPQGLPIIKASQARPSAAIEWIKVGDALTYDVRYR